MAWVSWCVWAVLLVEQFDMDMSVGEAEQAGESENSNLHIVGDRMKRIDNDADNGTRRERPSFVGCQKKSSVRTWKVCSVRSWTSRSRSLCIRKGCMFGIHCDTFCNRPESVLIDLQTFACKL